MAKKKMKISNLNNTLRSFLYNMLYDIDTLTENLVDTHSLRERRNFIYNCALNSINEFIEHEAIYLESKTSGEILQKIFEQNMFFKSFSTPKFTVKLSNKTQKLIEHFDYLKQDLDNFKRNEIMSSVDNLLASTI